MWWLYQIFPVFYDLFIHVSYVFMFYQFICLYEGVKYRGTGITDSGELPYGCWDLNLSSMAEKLVFLIVEPSIQPLLPVFNKPVDKILVEEDWNSNELTTELAS